jgi:hypothetical protein
MYETRRIIKSFSVVNPQEISIIIITELLHNSKDSEMYRLGVVAVLGRVSVVRQPGNGRYHGWG